MCIKIDNSKKIRTDQYVTTVYLEVRLRLRDKINTNVVGLIKKEKLVGVYEKDTKFRERAFQSF